MPVGRQAQAMESIRYGEQQTWLRSQVQRLLHQPQPPWSLGTFLEDEKLETMAATTHPGGVKCLVTSFVKTSINWPQSPFAQVADMVIVFGEITALAA